MLKTIITALFLFVSVATMATGQTVVVDRAPDASLLGGGIAGGIFTDRAGEEVSALTVVTFDSNVTIGAVTVFTTNFGSAIPSVGYPVGDTSPAVLNIFTGSTLGAGDDTLSGGDFVSNAVSAEYTAVSTGLEVSVTGQSISLAAGTYLIGITPTLEFAVNGQEFFQDAGTAGLTTFLNNPGGALFLPDPETLNASDLDLPTAFTGMAIRIETQSDVLLGDVNMDGVVDLLDIAPFVDAIINGIFIPEADVNGDGVVDLLDINPFVDLILGN